MEHNTKSLSYTEINAKTIDSWVKDGWEWGVPVTHDTCQKAQEGKWDVLLSPTRPVPHNWFLPFEGSKLLGLASGGGQQMPIFSILGAKCTLMDLSDRQLESDRMVADREGYEIEIIKADMTKRFPFEDETFHQIFHPVSNCYIEDVYHVWRECYRVLKPGGVLLSGLGNEVNYIFSEEATKLEIDNVMPFNPLKNPDQMKKIDPDRDGVQFSHSFDEQIGGQLKAGFVLVDAYMDWNAVPYESDCPISAAGIAAFWVTKAVKNKP